MALDIDKKAAITFGLIFLVGVGVGMAGQPKLKKWNDERTAKKKSGTNTPAKK